MTGCLLIEFVASSEMFACFLAYFHNTLVIILSDKVWIGNLLVNSAGKTSIVPSINI